MSSLNKVTIIGNVGKTPDIRETQNGKQIASFSVACSEKWKDKSTGNSATRTEWIPVVVFNEQLVSLVKSYVKKGSKIYVEGSFVTRKWTDKENVDRYVTEVVLQYNGKILLLDSKGEQEPSTHDQAKQNAYVEEELDDELPF